MNGDSESAGNTELRKWQVFPDAEALAQCAVEHIVAAAATAVREDGSFRIVLAGGGTPLAVYSRLAEMDLNWSHWHFYFGDERCLPEQHPDRNSVMAQQSLLEKIPVPAHQVHPIPAELGAEAAATVYARTLRSAAPFHLVLLGLGEDGHTASLFPGQEHDLQSVVVAVHDAPKPPPDRVSLNYPVLSSAQQVLFLVAGRGKREAVRAWRQGEDLPASRISAQQQLRVMLDSTAWDGWLVYMIHCSDDSYYTGITNDLQRRFEQHRNKTGAKFFYAREPLRVVYVEACADRSQASKREAAIKALTRPEKIHLAHTMC